LFRSAERVLAGQLDHCPSPSSDLAWEAGVSMTGEWLMTRIVIICAYWEGSSTESG